MKKCFDIRKPRPNTILIERGAGLGLERRYAAAAKAAKYRRNGWTVWVAAGTGWKRAE